MFLYGGLGLVVVLILEKKEKPCVCEGLHLD